MVAAVPGISVSRLLIRGSARFKTMPKARGSWVQHAEDHRFVLEAHPVQLTDEPLDLSVDRQADRKGAEGLVEYRAEKNARSIDGLPGL